MTATISSTESVGATAAPTSKHSFAATSTSLGESGPLALEVEIARPVQPSCRPAHFASFSSRPYILAAGRRYDAPGVVSSRDKIIGPVTPRLLIYVVPIAVILLLASPSPLRTRMASGDLRAVSVGIIAILVLWFFVSFAESLRREGSPTIESHWGGLGGGIGGWRLSLSLVYLLGLIAFGLLLVVATWKPDEGSAHAGASGSSGPAGPTSESALTGPSGSSGTSGSGVPSGAKGGSGPGGASGANGSPGGSPH
jgi:hypothetical protein